MRTMLQFGSSPLGDSVINVSRQVWLASLGAAVVTRDWAQAEGGNAFRKMVKEGTAIESRTFRMVGDRLEDSFAVANVFWKKTRGTVRMTVRKAADTAVILMQNNRPKPKARGSVPTPPAKKNVRPAAATKRAAPAQRGSKSRPANAGRRKARTAKPSTGK